MVTSKVGSGVGSWVGDGDGADERVGTTDGCGVGS
jgi:hypothetical protein